MTPMLSRRLIAVALLGALAAGLILAADSATGQAYAPQRSPRPLYEPHAISWILNNAEHDQRVTIVGEIAATLGDGEYIFEDATAPIRIRSWRRENWSAGDRLIIRGEVKEGLRGTYIKVVRAQSETATPRPAQADPETRRPSAQPALLINLTSGPERPGAVQAALRLAEAAAKTPTGVVVILTSGAADLAAPAGDADDPRRPLHDRLLELAEGGARIILDAEAAPENAGVDAVGVERLETTDILRLVRRSPRVVSY